MKQPNQFNGKTLDQILQQLYKRANKSLYNSVSVITTTITLMKDQLQKINKQCTCKKTQGQSQKFKVVQQKLERLCKKIQVKSDFRMYPSIQKCVKCVQFLDNVFQQRNRTIKQLKKKNEELKKENEELKKKLQGSKQDQKIKQQQYSKLIQQKNYLQSQLQNQKKKNEHLQKLKLQNKKKLRQVSCEKVNFISSTNKKMRQSERLKTETETLKSTNEILKTQNERLNKEISKQNQSLNQCYNQQQISKQEIKKLKYIVKQLKRTSQLLKKKVDELSFKKYQSKSPQNKTKGNPSSIQNETQKTQQRIFTTQIKIKNLPESDIVSKTVQKNNHQQSINIIFHELTLHDQQIDHITKHQNYCDTYLQTGQGKMNYIGAAIKKYQNQINKYKEIQKKFNCQNIAQIIAQTLRKNFFF